MLPVLTQMVLQGCSRKGRWKATALALVLACAALSPLRLAAAADGDGCIHAPLGVLLDAVKDRPVKSQIALDAEFHLGRALTEEQARVLEAVRPGQNLAEIKNSLRARGIEGAELGVLEREGFLLGRRPIWADIAPTQLHIHDLGITALGKEQILRLRSGETLQYAQDLQGNIHILDDIITTRENGFFAIRARGEPPGETLVLRELGELKMNAKTGVLDFQPKYALDVSDQEVQEFHRVLEEAHPELKISRTEIPGRAKARILDCAAVMARQQAGPRVIFDRVLADNLVTGAVLTTGELLGKSRLQTEHGRDVVAADFVGGNINGVISGAIFYMAYQRPIGARSLMALRLGVGELGNLTQWGVHNLMVESTDQRQNPSGKLALFNHMHFLARIPLNHYIDQGVMRKLPLYLYESCLRDPKARIFVSPRMVRIYERFGSTLIYYGLRDTFVNE